MLVDKISKKIWTRKGEESELVGNMNRQLNSKQLADKRSLELFAEFQKSSYFIDLIRFLKLNLVYSHNTSIKPVRATSLEIAFKASPNLSVSMIFMSSSKSTKLQFATREPPRDFETDSSFPNAIE